VLLGPEIALSQRFKTEVLYDQAFQDHIVLVVLDELHVVSQWGLRWRASYSQLAILRGIIDRSVPWLGCSATLDPVTLAEVRDLSGFNPSVHIQRTSIDRPDITFAIQAIQHTMNSFRDLEFLLKTVQPAVEQVSQKRRENIAREALNDGGIIAAQEVFITTRHQRIGAGPESRACCKTIPKTIVYVDKIQQIMKVVRVLRTMLIQAGCSKKAALDAIQAYHAELAEWDKRRISTEFEKPDKESVSDSSKHRVIVATDAMGMGINNPDVRLVVQWGIPQSMDALMQRAGRAARGRGICGKFVWLVPPWCFGERIEHMPLQTAKKHMTHRERRSVLPRGIWEIINHSDCIPRGILEFFGEHTTCTRPAEACGNCSRCTGDEVKAPASKAGRPIKIVQSPKHITEAVKLALVRWREAKAVDVFSSSFITTTPAELILPDKALTMISRAAKSVTSISALVHAVNGEWGHLALYGKEVLEVTQEACIQQSLQKLNLGR